MISYIDIHSHPHFKDFDADRESLLSQMVEEGVMTIAIGTDLEESKKAISLAEGNAHVYAAIGFHPADNSTEVFDYNLYLELAKHSKVVAIGECGLDYFHHTKDKETQVNLFTEHIRLAHEVNKPLMLHVRPKEGMDAYEDALDILSEAKKKNPSLKGNFHFFVGNEAIAKRVVDIGFTVSFSGVITFVKDYEAVVKYIPITHMHAETDSPYVAPVPMRGKRNSPLYVKYVVAKIAEIKNISVEEVQSVLLENAQRDFGIGL